MPRDGGQPRDVHGPGASVDFALTEEQRGFRDAVADFARKELTADVVGRDRTGTFSREAWKKCAEFGLQGLPVPEEYGGSGADPVTIVAALEGLGYGSTDNGLVFALNAQMWSCEMPLVTFGTDDQKRCYLPRLCDGSLIAAHCMSEPGSGSDAFSLTTSARRIDGGYLLTGSKTFVTNGPESGLFLVFATTDTAKRIGGICAFLIERDTPGLSVGRPLEKMGLRTSGMSEVFFDSCQVTDEQMLGEPGGGVALFNSSMVWERGLILAAAVGAMRRQLERAIEHARTRKQSGAPIGSFQAVAHRIVEMKLRLETARLLTYRVAWLLANDRPAGLDSALAKLHLSESLVASSLDAMHVHGGYGYMTEYELERDVRDAIGSRLYSGTSEIQRNLVARHLGL